MWRRVEDFLGHDAIAYDLRAANGDRATLYVISRQWQLPPDPYRQPALETGGLWATAWQEGDVAYLLVAQGARRHGDPLRLFLRTQSPIL